MMKQITNISSKGITYTDEDNNSQFIDFEVCSQNFVKNMENRLGANKFTDQDREFWQKAKYVGLRVTFRQPPAIEFYTTPRIYFEFPTADDVRRVAYMIKKVGWRTNDGE